jgi:hypothetical protein
MEGIFGIVIALVLIGVALYIISLIPMDSTIKQIIRVVVIVAVCLWMLDYYGLYSVPFFHFHHR